MTFSLAPKEKELLFVLKVVCPQYTSSLPDSGNCYFLVFQNACPNQTFTCPRQSGKCLCSTLSYPLPLKRISDPIVTSKKKIL